MVGAISSSRDYIEAPSFLYDVDQDIRQMKVILPYSFLKSLLISFIAYFESSSTPLLFTTTVFKVDEFSESVLARSTNFLIR